MNINAILVRWRDGRFRFLMATDNGHMDVHPNMVQDLLDRGVPALVQTYDEIDGTWLNVGRPDYEDSFEGDDE